ncbi:MAG TPA: imidazole glycerol phosphate synthase subunit HisH [Gemmatimonas sp.]|nr:imidazole glycerol phosphate synthase subunit HisH [Gemmatimonas sp.]
MMVERAGAGRATDPVPATDGTAPRRTTPLRVTVFDYGAGNLHSLIKSLESGGAAVHVETDPARAVQDTDALVLPGVGAFTPAAERMRPGLEVMRAALRDGLPCLGICLGMQLLFDGSDEGPGEGLGIISGHVTKLDAERVPQIGWNSLDDSGDPLITGAGLETAYYANSYVCRPHGDGIDTVVAWSEHQGDRFPASVRAGSVMGTQFHPEKSSTPGVRFVHAFLAHARSQTESHRRSPAHATATVTATGVQP